MNFKQFRAISNFCVNTVIVKNTFVTKRARQFFFNHFNNYKNDFFNMLSSDYLLCNAFNDAYLMINPKHHFNEYLKDYAERYQDAVSCTKDLNEVLNVRKYRLINDSYYSNFLANGSYDKKDFDTFGLLKTEPVREFIDLQKDWYETSQLDLIDDYEISSGKNAKGLILLYDYRKNLLNQATDLYLGKQFDYMELLSSKRETKNFQFVIDYLIKKENSFKDCEYIINLALKGLLRRRDVNDLHENLVNDSELLNTNSVCHYKENYVLLNDNGEPIDDFKIANFEKNCKFFYKELLALKNKKEHSQNNGRSYFFILVICMLCA